MIAGKTKNSLRNIVFGVSLKVYQLIVPFIIRTVMIYSLGLEYVGLNSLFTSILQVLNIAELGVGYALVYSMYEPIEHNNKDKICALMKVYQTYYRIIGLVILVLGIIITPFLPKLIAGDVPADINLYIIYFLNLGATVFSYWLFAYKNSLFSAHQRNDIISKITLAIDTVKYLIQILVLLLFKNYYLYLIVLLATQLLNNIVTAIFATKMFPDYKPCGTLDKDEKQKLNSSIKDLFTSQLGMVVTTSVDSIVISVFLGLVPLAIYQNYYYILSALIALINIVFISCRAAMGTNIITKSIEQNYEDFKKFSFVVNALLCFSITCLMSLFQPFIMLWVGADSMLDIWCVLLFCVYLYFYILSLLISCYKNAAGHWHKDRFRPLIVAFVNLGTNILLIHFIGIYGIILSTIVSFAFIDIPWIFHRTFTDVFNKSLKKSYFINILINFFTICISAGLGYLCCYFIVIENLYLQLLVNLVICATVSVGIFVLFNVKNPVMKSVIKLTKRVFGNRKG